ncbi:hypothetical protein NW768_011218 [Fusarium equiseti]|uniref:Uncharacterized protein n=1 Tax=Fusarium equiseti TaxID=61235 RepID=A0ABQ8QYK1_FUSEQ|nr:hypothetical protein NW768_011218 [Fusarium equiseti]
MKPEERTWEAIVERCAKNPLLAPLDDGVYNADSLIKHNSRDFKTDGSPDASIVREVETWFKKLIADEDVIKSTKIDINTLGRIVAQSGATIDSFETFFVKTEKHKKTMLDIGVLRYPDSLEDNNGIDGVYNMRRYKPRSSVIDKLRDDVKDKAVKDAEDLLSF